MKTQKQFPDVIVVANRNRPLITQNGGYLSAPSIPFVIFNDYYGSKDKKRFSNIGKLCKIIAFRRFVI
jgi:hypothetical protein